MTSQQLSAELTEVRDFLASHAPFSDLPPEVLDELPGRLTIRYLRRGTRVMQVGQPSGEVFVIRSGAVDISDASGDLVEREGEGGTFGATTILQGSASEHDVTTIEDTLVYVAPGAVFVDLASHHPVIAQHFVRQAVSRLRHADATPDPLLRTRVRELLGHEPVTVAPSATIREAAQVMTDHRVSSLLVLDEGRLRGILTDRDLRSRVVAAGADTGAPVASVMTPDPLTTEPDALAFELLLRMTSRGIHHLPVVEDGTVRGVVTTTDLMRLEQANPIYLARDIGAQEDVDGIVAAHERLPQVVERLVAVGTDADDVQRVVTGVADAVHRRLCELAEKRLGPPPVPYAWVALGSQARHEMSLGSDQDHAIVRSDGPVDGVDEHDGWFAALAEQVVDGLERCGYARCDGDVMATNPRWRQNISGWRREFAHWLDEPTPDSVLHAGIFFDMRAVHGDASLVEALRADVVGATPGAQRFLAHLTTHAVQNEPPLGFFRGFVLEREGEHRDELDVKRGGTAAVVEIARVHALTAGLLAVGTRERLLAARAANVISQERADGLVEALDFLSDARVRHQADQMARGENPDNFVAPDALSSSDKRRLKEAFNAIRSAQSLLGQSPAVRMLS